ncbi:sensor domain-containing diguanylate cyclase [Actinoplanes sp. NPDC049596]|uniref:sensor domain-containing diguanylate cyclase n=1 Tax=unclassified Actinoplanes TaxID=2626549 RepID=UPI003446F99C
MEKGGRRTLALSAAVALVLIVLVGGYLLYTDRAAVRRVHRDFQQRAEIAGQVTTSAFTASDRQNREAAEQMFSGDAASVQAALDNNPTTTFGAVLSANGNLVAAQSGTLSALRDRTAIDAVAALSLQRSAMTFANFADTPKGRLLLFGVPFTAGGQTRVWVGSVPTDTINGFASGYLIGSLGVREGRAYIVDAHGLVVAASGTDPLAAPIPDARLRAAVARAASGTVGNTYFTSAAVPGSGWRIVFVAPDHVLLQPVGKSRQLAWQLFGSFALAVAGAAALAGLALSRSARLAHERMHDGLTGLPNRILFTEKADRALAAAARRGELAALLFIDLDGFKPVNDTYGHAVGDELLTAVADRLRTMTRQNGLICRFGGDEFVLVCTGLATEEESSALAERVRLLIAEPYTLDGRTVRIGSSVGVAMQRGGVESAAALIQRADLAMYDIKKQGRGGRQPAGATAASGSGALGEPVRR